METEFWKHKNPKDFTQEEWEAICTHCGKCCVQKFEHPKTKAVVFTNITCEHLSLPTCFCKIYKDRLKCGHCTEVNLKMVQTMPELLPQDCAYKWLVYKHELPDWHPLITNESTSALSNGKSVIAYAPVPENAPMDQQMRNYQIIEIDPY